MGGKEREEGTNTRLARKSTRGLGSAWARFFPVAGG